MPAPTFTANDLKQILVDQVGLEEDDFPDDLDTSFAAVGLDSLALIEMALALEHDYGLNVSDLDLSTLTTPRATIDHANVHLMEVIAGGPNR